MKRKLHLDRITYVHADQEVREQVFKAGLTIHAQRGSFQPVLRYLNIIQPDQIIIAALQKRRAMP
jgi:hypothetical protein